MKIIEASAIISAKAGDMSGIDKLAANVMKVSKASKAVGTQFSGAAADMSKRVQQIGAALAKIDNFRSMSRGLDQASIAMKQAQQTASRLKTAMDAMSSPTAKMRAEYARASAAVERTTSAFKDQGQAVRAARSALETAGIPINQIARQQAQLTSALNMTTAAMQRQAQAGRVLIGASRPSGRTAADVPHNGYMIRPGSKVIDVGSGHGAGLAIGVHSMARVAAHGAHAANDLSNAVNQARMSGMTAEEVEEATTKAADLSSRYPSISQAQIVEMVRTQRSVTGDFHHAMDAISDNVRLRAVAQMKMPGQDVGSGLELLNKSMEIAGVTGDPARHHRYMNYTAKMLNTFGGTLRFEDIADMIKYSRGAGTNLSEGFYAGILPTIASELGGSGAGTALATSYQALVGGQMKHAAAVALNSYGLINPAGIIKTKTGSIKGIKPGSVVGSELFQTDPFAWVQTYLKPALEQKGIGANDKKGQSEAIASMFSNRMAQQFISILLQQATRLEKDRALSQGAEGLEAADRNQQRDTGTAIKGVTTAFDNLTATLTGPVLEKGVPAINTVSAALNQLANWGQQNPGQAGAVGIATLAGGTYVASKGASWFLRQVGAQLGLGGGAAAGEAAAGAAAGATSSGVLGAIAGGAARIVSSPLGLIFTTQALLEAGKPTSKEGFPYRFDTWSPDALALYERSRRAQIELKQGADMEGARGRAMMDVSRRSQLEVVRPAETQISVTGSAQNQTTINLVPTGEFSRLVQQVQQVVTSNVPLRGGSGPGSTGTSMPEAAAPNVGSGNPMGPR